MPKPLRIALVYESQDYLLGKFEAAEESALYHWREPEEIEAVRSALIELGHQVDDIGPLEAVLEKYSEDYRPDLVWNLSVGVLSRNRTAIAPAVLEQMGIPYTGGDAALRGLLLNKNFLKPWLSHHAMATPPWIEIDRADELPAALPWDSAIVKPACEGFSIGVGLFHANQAASNALMDFVTTWLEVFPQGLIMEQYIRGREFTCSCIRNYEPIAVSEVLFPAGTEIIDLDAKRHNRVDRTVLPEADALHAPIVQMASRIMTRLPDLDYASFDFRADVEGNLYLIDINPDATLHPQRAFVKSFACDGVAYTGFIDAILDLQRTKWRLG